MITTTVQAVGPPPPRQADRPTPHGADGRLASLLVAVGVIFATCTAFAQAPGNRPPPGHKRVLSVPKAAGVPKIDGVLDDEAWKGAAVADRFWIPEQERWPAEQTEVLVTADAKVLYFAFRVQESQPDRIVALETRRDASLQKDDMVCVELDPFLSHREVSEYCVNARGTVSDSIAGGRARQEAWKGTWQGAAGRTPYGWSVEMAIPFEVLNYEAGATTFGANFLRYHNRTSEWSRWADTTVQDLPEERGRLTGLAPAPGAHRSPLMAMPYVLYGRNIPDKDGDIQETLFNGGIDIRYQPTSSLTGVLSINPDFSQVEEAVTDIAFSYNEKYKADNRPFFQEGASYFGKKEYFYSNSVPDFYVGAKLFGRRSGVMYGLLVTRSPDERTDGVLQVQWEADARHSISGMFVGTDQPGLRNGLLYANFQGRERIGLMYQIDAAASRTELQPAEGWFLSGMAGWKGDFWTPSITVDRYTLDFQPELGQLNTDLLDTWGVLSSISYYRDMGPRLVSMVTAYATSNWRETSDGLLQQSNISAGGTIDLRKFISMGVFYSAGPYRPLLDGIPGNWSDNVNHDRTLSGSIDLNTQSKFFNLGGYYTQGKLGGGDYEYMSAYVTGRPTATTSLNVTAERVYSFGYTDQVVATAGWDVTPRHALYARYIWNDDNQFYRVAYTGHIWKNVDLFVVYDKQPEQDFSISAKLVVSLPIPTSLSGAPPPKTHPDKEMKNRTLGPGNGSLPIVASSVVNRGRDRY